MRARARQGRDSRATSADEALAGTSRAPAVAGEPRPGAGQPRARLGARYARFLPPESLACSNVCAVMVAPAALTAHTFGERSRPRLGSMVPFRQITQMTSACAPPAPARSPAHRAHRIQARPRAPRTPNTSAPPPAPRALAPRRPPRKRALPVAVRLAADRYVRAVDLRSPGVTTRRGPRMVRDEGGGRGRRGIARSAAHHRRSRGSLLRCGPARALR